DREIGIHSIRGGNVVGEHEVLFAGPDEVVKISHSISSRDMFAKGALAAARFMNDKKTGWYSMADLIQGH
ncbi:MAG: 4-hydroxy-tetrahydrodipicolinate reductase, partial [Clostridiaceae bacterium]|nr:4-hydroxy-tetrahydrodipicolinate reductase [Clostridiaceae bacterium]